MKKLFLSIAAITFTTHLNAQSNDVKMEELETPNSTAFKLLDVSPSLIETPHTTKEFSLGVLNAFNKSQGWPQNYSMEFTPYWWLDPSKRNVYNFLGIKRVADSAQAGRTLFNGGSPFAGLKFTTFSIAFLQQDMVPDSLDVNQKVFSIGMHTTVIKLFPKEYYTNLNDKINQWHDAAQQELEKIQAELVPGLPPDSVTAILKRTANAKDYASSEIAAEINELYRAKPFFELDVAGAYSTYGINDSTWKTGRVGAWLVASSFIPLGKRGPVPSKNYFDLFFYLRYMGDHYANIKPGSIGKANTVDIGGKLLFEFDKLSIGAETIYRSYHQNDYSDNNNRLVGILNYKVKNSLYVYGAYGKDFGPVNHLVAFFGINWGFGSEKVNLPKLQ